MSRAKPCVLFAGPGGWRIGVVDGGRVEVSGLGVPADATVDQVSDAVRAAMDTRNLGERFCGDIVLAAPSSWCLCVELTCEPAGRHWRESMSYALEQKLPLTSEQVVADYIVHVEDETPMALAATLPLERVSALVEALRVRGIAARHLCPAALLVHQQLRASGELADDDTLLLAEAGGFALLRCRDGMPVTWHWVAGSVEQVFERLAQLATSPSRVVACGLDADQALCFTSHESGAGGGGAYDLVVLDHVEPDQSAALAAWRVLKGRWRPWIELARGPLAVVDSWTAWPSVRGALGGVIVLLLAVNIAMVYRSHLYDRWLADQHREQHEAYQRALSSSPPQTMISRRMESEYAALIRQPRVAVEAENNVPMLRLIWEVFRRMPYDHSVEWSRVRLEADYVLIEGCVESQEVVTELTRRLYSDDALRFDPPRVQAIESGDSQGVCFVIEGSWR